MGNLIQWPRAVYWTKTYNPVVGCEPCSPACANCYAKAWADRFKISFVPHRTTKQKPPTKGICFCGNVSDLFGDWVDGPLEFITNTAKSANSRATYLYLTKRVERMCDVLGSIVMGTPYTNPSLFANHYFGFTAENQEWFDKRMSIVRESFPLWAKLWISVEPMLGPIDMKLSGMVSKPNTVIVGCESGSNRRFCDLKWITNIVDQCREVNVPVFVKQLCLESGKFTNKIEEFPKHLQIRQLGWL